MLIYEESYNDDLNELKLMTDRGRQLNEDKKRNLLRKLA